MPSVNAVVAHAHRPSAKLITAADTPIVVRHRSTHTAAGAVARPAITPPITAMSTPTAIINNTVAVWYLSRHPEPSL